MESFLAAVQQRAVDGTTCRTSKLPNGIFVESREGRGRCMVLSRAAMPGEALIGESPVCWYVDVARHEDVCARCLAVMPAGGQSGCQLCHCACWCSERCREEDSSRHAGICGMLKATGAHAKYVSGELTETAANLLHFSVHALALHSDEPAAFEQLWGLSDTGVDLDETETEAVVQVAGLFVTAQVPRPPMPVRTFFKRLILKIWRVTSPIRSFLLDSQCQ